MKEEEEQQVFFKEIEKVKNSFGDYKMHMLGALNLTDKLSNICVGLMKEAAYARKELAAVMFASKILLVSQWDCKRHFNGTYIASEFRPIGPQALLSGKQVYTWEVPSIFYGLDKSEML